jgi:hypothetical protein
MATGFEILGAALGGNSEEAYQEGRAVGAKTEEALANARRRVMENDALARGRSTLIAQGVPEPDADAAYTALQAGGKLDDPIQLMLKSQEHGFRSKIADSSVPFAQANRFAMAIDGKPTDRFQKVGAGADDRFDEAGLQPLGDMAGDPGGGTSAGMQALRAFGFLNPDGSVKAGREADAFDLYRDTTKNLDAGGEIRQTTNNPFRRGPATVVAPVTEVATNTGLVKSASEQGAAIGRNAAGLESTNSTIDKFTSDIDNFLAKPGYDSLYGNLQGTEVGKAIGGVVDPDIADARAALETLGGEAFLASIQKMRGFGQLSNQEGVKVQTALTRALDTRTSDSRVAWQEVKKHMAELKRVAAIEAGQGGQQPAAPAAAAPATGAVGEVKMMGGKKYVRTGPNSWAEDDGT